MLTKKKGSGKTGAKKDESRALNLSPDTKSKGRPGGSSQDGGPKKRPDSSNRQSSENATPLIKSPDHASNHMDTKDRNYFTSLQDQHLYSPHTNAASDPADNTPLFETTLAPRTRYDAKASGSGAFEQGSQRLLPFQSSFGKEPEIRAFGQRERDGGHSNQQSRKTPETRVPGAPSAAVRKSRLDDMLAGNEVDEVIADKFGGRATLGSTILA